MCLLWLYPSKERWTPLNNSHICEKSWEKAVSMRNVIWINSSQKDDTRVFDSDFEVEEWARALYPDFVAYLREQTNVGYATPDEKVINYLASHFPQWADYINLKVGVCTAEIERNGQIIYKIWTVKL